MDRAGRGLITGLEERFELLVGAVHSAGRAGFLLALAAQLQRRLDERLGPGVGRFGLRHGDCPSVRARDEQNKWPRARRRKQEIQAAPLALATAHLYQSHGGKAISRRAWTAPVARRLAARRRSRRGSNGAWSNAAARGPSAESHPTESGRTRPAIARCGLRSRAAQDATHWGRRTPRTERA